MQGPEVGVRRVYRGEGTVPRCSSGQAVWGEGDTEVRDQELQTCSSSLRALPGAIPGEGRKLLPNPPWPPRHASEEGP